MISRKRRKQVRNDRRIAFFSILVALVASIAGAVQTAYIIWQRDLPYRTANYNYQIQHIAGLIGTTAAAAHAGIFCIQYIESNDQSCGSDRANEAFLQALTRFRSNQEEAMFLYTPELSRSAYMLRRLVEHFNVSRSCDDLQSLFQGIYDFRSLSIDVMQTHSLSLPEPRDDLFLSSGTNMNCTELTRQAIEDSEESPPQP